MESVAIDMVVSSVNTMFSCAIVRGLPTSSALRKLMPPLFAQPRTMTATNRERSEPEEQRSDVEESVAKRDADRIRIACTSTLRTLKDTNQQN